jgi:hypothetical protein
VKIDGDKLLKSLHPSRVHCKQLDEDIASYRAR